MQKKLIAAAVAALASTGAMAQVTLYGVADAALFNAVQEKANGDSKVSGVLAGNLSGSRLGVKAEDDIGGGLKGVVVYETAVNLDSTGTIDATATTTVGGTSGLFGITRQSYVGLTGGFGRVSLGRQYSPGYFAALASDGFAGGAIGPQSMLSVGAAMLITPNSGARVDNSINYVSNAMGPLTLNVLYGFGENADYAGNAPGTAGTTSKVNSRLGVGAQAKFGPATIDATYETKENVNAATNGTLTVDEFLVGAAFNAGFATFGASYQKADADTSTTGTREDELISVSAVVPIGAGNVHVGYGMLTRTTNAVGNVEGEITALTVAYTHALSKKTTAYVAYMQAEGNEAVGTAAVGGAAGTGAGFAALGTLGSVINNGTNSAIALGMRVVF